MSRYVFNWSEHVGMSVHSFSVTIMLQILFLWTFRIEIALPFDVAKCFHVASTPTAFFSLLVQHDIAAKTSRIVYGKHPEVSALFF
jgi:hypothetical protein